MRTFPELIQHPFQPLLAAVEYRSIDCKDAPKEAVSENKVDVAHAMPLEKTNSCSEISEADLDATCERY
jgi:hypothetical protein